MALKDCLKKMREAGVTIDAEDERVIQEYIDAGMPDMAAVRRRYIERQQNVVDILSRVRSSGGDINPIQSDTVDEIVGRRTTVLSRTLETYQQERAGINDEIEQIDAETGEINQALSVLEIFAQVSGFRPERDQEQFELAVASDQALMQLFEFTSMQDRRRAKAGQTTILEAAGIAAKTAQQIYDNYAGVLRRRAELAERKYDLQQRMIIMERRVDTMFDRESRNPDFSIGADGNYTIDPGDPDGVAEDVINYSVSYASEKPWTIKSSGEGDLYIRRHGKNAGMPSKERQSDNDLAISFNQNLLLPDYMYYVLQFLQPQIAERARGTAQQAIRIGDVDQLIVEFFQKQAREPTPTDYKVPKKPKGDLYAAEGLSTDRRMNEATMNYKAIVAPEEVRSIATGVTNVTTPEEAAHVVADVRREAQENFLALILDADNNVLAIAQHAKGSIDATSVFPSIMAGHILSTPGAAKVWFAHNHPSGEIKPSAADERITRVMEDLMRGSSVEIQGHVVLAAGRDRFSLLGADGVPISYEKQVLPAARNKSVPMTSRRVRGPKDQDAPKISSPASAETVIRESGLEEGIVFLDNRHRVLGIMEMTGDEMERLRGTGQLDRLLKAESELNAAAMISVTRDMRAEASSNLAQYADRGGIRLLDHFYRNQHDGLESTVLQFPNRLQPTADRTFNQDLIGFTSGLLEGAKAMPQNKGPADQMLAVLKKQPGVKKAEMEAIELEEWVTAKGYVTKEELIDYIDKSGVKVEEFYFVQPDPKYNSEEIRARLIETRIFPLDIPGIDWESVVGRAWVNQHRSGTMNPDSYYEFEGFRKADLEEEEIWFAARYDDPETNRSYYAVSEHFVTEDGDLSDATNVTIVDAATENIVHDSRQIVGLVGAQFWISHTISDSAPNPVAGPGMWDIRGPTRFHVHTLDGGTNQREIVFRLPPPDVADEVRVSGQVMGNSDVIDDALMSIAADLPHHESLDYGRIEGEGGVGGDIIEFNDFNSQDFAYLESIVADNPLLLNVTSREGRTETARYTRSHAYNDWDNILMWARINERTGANGERILFIEEIQSDWHQEGQTSGYRNRSSDWQEARQAVTMFRERADALWEEARGAIDVLLERTSINNRGFTENRLRVELQANDWLRWVERNIGLDGRGPAFTPQHMDAINRWRDEEAAAAAAQATLNQQMSRGVPDAPFKGDGWAALAMKRLLRMAAQEGFDQLAWTTGDQQNIRWDLGQVTTWINWNPTTDELTASHGFSRIVPAEELDRYVGRQIAATLRNKADEQRNNYEIMDTAEADVTFDDIEYFWGGVDGETEVELADGTVITPEGYDIAPGYVAVDVNGEIMRDEFNEILYHETVEDLQEAMELHFESSGFTVTAEGDELVIGGQGMRNFYDNVLKNVTNKAVRKMDKKAKVDSFGKEILVLSENYIRHQNRLIEEYRERRREALMTKLPGWQQEAHELLARADELEDQLTSNIESSKTAVHGIDITPEISNGVYAGQTLFQSRRRGSISFDQSNRAIIRLTSARDMSTFLHESGHLYLELLGDMAEMIGASDQVKNDYNTILEYLGVEQRSQIERIHHEKFARSYEAYLREGKAPDPALRDIFRAFTAWLHQIYKQLRQLDVELTPEIRGVFDRMLATDAAIKQAEDMQQFVTLFTSADEMGISQEAFEVYRGTAAAAHEEESDRLQREMLAAMRREEQAWWQDERNKVEEEVRQEAYGMRVYRVLSLLQRGTNPDGTTPAGSTYKIDKRSLLRALSFSQATLNKLPRPYIYTTSGGVDVNVVAREFGYESAQEMITEIMRAAPMDAFIRSETDARMLERFPDPLVSGELQEQAMEAVHNQKRAQVLAAEMRAIRKRIREDRPIVEAERQADRRQRLAEKAKLPRRGELAMIKEAAKQVIADMRVRDVKPHEYLAAERQAGRRAFAALERKDYEAAYKHKRQQIVNHEMYRAAIAARDAADKTRRYLAKFERKAVRQRMGKAGVLDRIDAALEHFNFRKISLAQVDRENAQQQLMDALEEGILSAPESLIDKLTLRGTNYQDLTNAELKGLRDVVAQLEMMGKRQFEIIVNGEKKMIEDDARELADGMRLSGKPMPLKVGTETLSEAAKKTAKSGLFNVLRPGAIARILDGAEYGAFTQKIIEPIRRAYTEKMLPWFVDMEETLAGIYRKHYDDDDLRGLNTERVEIKSLGQSMTRADMISVALNWGNDGNRAALLGGRHPVTGEPVFTDAAVREIMAKLRKRDYDFIQEVWDYVGSYYDDKKDERGNVIREGIATVERRRRGVAPQKVEAAPFTVRTVEGEEIEMRGGYYPLIYDRRFSKRQRKQEFDDAMQNMTNGTFVRAQTRAGSTHERVRNHGKVVRIGLGVIDRHLREVIRDIAIGDEVNYVKKLLDNTELDNAFQETNNNEALIVLNRWLVDAAVGELPANNFTDQALAYVRTGFTKAKLGWNLTTMVLQVTGFAQTAATVGTGVMMRGLGKYMANPVENWKFIIDSSAFMTQRYVNQSWNKDVMDTRAQLEAFPLFGVGPTKIRRRTMAFAKTLFVPIMAVQSQVDAVTWMAEYQKRMNEHQDHKKAVLQADAMVEKAQTSGFFSDRSAIERGTISDKTVQAQAIRIWTTLISYMMAKSGIAAEKAIELRRTAQAGEMTFGTAVKFASDMIMLFTIEGMLAALVYGTVPDWEDDEEDSFAWWAVKVTGESMLSGIPFARETLSMRYGGGNTPIGGLAKDAVNLYTQIGQGEIDQPLLKAINNVGGTLFHYPSTQTNRIIETAWAEYVEGEDRPVTEYLTGERDEE